MGFNIYEQDKFYFQLSWAWKQFYNLEAWYWVVAMGIEYLIQEQNQSQVNLKQLGITKPAKLKTCQIFDMSTNHR